MDVKVAILVELPPLTIQWNWLYHQTVRTHQC